MCGSEKDIPYGESGDIFSKFAAIADRSSWLWGYEAGVKELEDFADDAVRLAAYSNPVAAAALRYADLVHETQISRNRDEHREARAEAGRALIHAIRDADWSRGVGVDAPED